MKNYTPHEIIFYSENDCIYDQKTRKMILRENAKPLKIIKSSGILNASISTKKVGEIAGIVEFETKYENVDPYPETTELLIVSFLYASAAKFLGWDTSQLRTLMTVYKKVEGGKLIPAGAYAIAKV